MIGCNGVKKTQEAINTGDYNNAIGSSLQNLRENKTKKANQPYIVLLEEAFKKNQERELQHIAFLRQDGNPANYEAIFSSYNALKQIQQQIRPLLPLYLNEENRYAQFNFKNYDDNIISVKQELSDYLYTNATMLLTNATHKQDYRKAYEDFKYLEKINPGYSNSKEKMQEAYSRGLDYVKVVMANHTDKVIPVKLEEELLNFNTYGLNDLWTEYHNNPLPDVNYDYAMEVSLKAIEISPEQIREKQIIKEKQVKDGYEYALDNDGKVVKDSLGNKIKIDKFKTVKCNFYQFTQYKTAQVSGVVNFTELNKQQLVNSYPLASEFKFEHIYARHDGDKRALENNLLSQLGLAAIPFPTNEQMVYDAGENLKSNLKLIMTQQRFN
tara:strand:+ start:339372 stop:340520 length:1149 start_codon:yes stop_codon:yes gene_type:complete